MSMIVNRNAAPSANATATVNAAATATIVIVNVSANAPIVKTRVGRTHKERPIYWEFNP